MTKGNGRTEAVRVGASGFEPLEIDGPMARWKKPQPVDFIEKSSRSSPMSATEKEDVMRRLGERSALSVCAVLALSIGL